MGGYKMEEEKTKERKKIDDNIIYIGGKPFPNYVMAVITQITKKKLGEIRIIARVKFISKAVDIAELARNKFSEGENKVTIGVIKIGSERFEKTEPDGRGREINVSVIEIPLIRAK